MATDLRQFSNSFKQASQCTDALLWVFAKSKRESLELAANSEEKECYQSATARRDDAIIIGHCIQIVKGMQMQQELIAQQKDIIITLEKRLAAVEAELNPRRPLLGKPPLEPKGP